MRGMDPQIEEIKAKIDIVQLIGQSVKLSRAGRNFKGLCPFHGENSPSFMVSPERGTWRCFGCGEHGDAFSFLEKYEHLTFVEALEQLAKKAGITLTKLTRDAHHRESKQRLYDMHSLAAEFYAYLLAEHPTAEVAREYLVQRNISAETSKQFTLGYAPNSWQSLTDFLQKKGFQPQEIVQSGLSTTGQNNSDYDRFRGRLMFPVADAMNRIVGFSGRSLDNTDKGPKYLNTGETDLFHKGRLLYGLSQAKEAIRKSDRLVLVEGNLDVLSSHQAGVKEVVAPLGTALTPEQVSLIKRFTQKVYLSFDGDKAGQEATRRSIQLLKEQELEVKVVQLLVGSDPDDCIQNDPKQWKASLNKAKDVFDYYLSWTTREFDLNTERGKREASQQLIPFLNATSDPVARAFLLQKAANALTIDEASLNQQLLQPRRIAKSSRFTVPVSVKNTTDSREYLLTTYLLSTLLSAPADELTPTQAQVLVKSISAESLAQDAHRRLLATITEVMKQEGSIKVEKIAQKLAPEDLEMFDQLSLTDPDTMVAVPQGWVGVLEGVIHELQSLYIKGQLERVSKSLKQAETLGLGGVDSLKEQFAQLTGQLAQAERHLSR